MHEIKCPKCGHVGSFIAGIAGTCEVTLSKIDKTVLRATPLDYTLDNSDHFDCANVGCDFETYDMDDFFSSPETVHGE